RPVGVFGVIHDLRRCAGRPQSNGDGDGADRFCVLHGVLSLRLAAVARALAYALTHGDATTWPGPSPPKTTVWFRVTGDDGAPCRPQAHLFNSASREREALAQRLVDGHEYLFDRH